MARKGFLSAAIFIIAAYTALSYTYTGDKAIYPAVHHAILNGNSAHWANSKATISDPNTIVINNVQVSDGLRIADFTLRISLVNNVVTYQFSNIRQRPITSTAWKSVKRFSQSDREQIFTNHFDTEIPKVMEDEALGGAPGGAPAPSSSSASLSFSLPLANPQNYLLYPAVSAAFTSLRASLGAKTADLWEIDTLGNQFTIRNCVAERRPMDLISYQIKITYRDNQLIVEFINIGPIGSNIMQYSNTEVESMPRFDTQRISEQLKTQIEQTLASTAVYSGAKKAFIANNNFLQRAFSPVTTMLRDEFATTLFKDGEISLNARVSDVRKNENAEFKNYTTEIRAILYPDSSGSRSFATISLYTSDSSLSRLKQGETIMLSGQFVRIDYSNLGVEPRFIMTK